MIISKFRWITWAYKLHCSQLYRHCFEFRFMSLCATQINDTTRHDTIIIGYRALKTDRQEHFISSGTTIVWPTEVKFGITKWTSISHQWCRISPLPSLSKKTLNWTILQLSPSPYCIDFWFVLIFMKFSYLDKQRRCLKVHFSAFLGVGREQKT